METGINIFVADDHPIVREGLISVLDTQEDFHIVGEASNGEEVMERLKGVSADILLLDIEMPKMDGVEVIQALKAANASVRVIVFTVFDSDERIMSAIKAGAMGYLLKGASRDEIFQAVRVVHQGGSLLQPVVATKLFQQMSNPSVRLSEREIEVLKLLAKGLPNKRIGEDLFISERTVKFHVSAILSKLGAQNRTEAVKIAVENGIIDL